MTSSISGPDLFQLLAQSCHGYSLNHTAYHKNWQRGLKWQKNTILCSLRSSLTYYLTTTKLFRSNHAYYKSRVIIRIMGVLWGNDMSHYAVSGCRSYWNARDTTGVWSFNIPVHWKHQWPLLPTHCTAGVCTPTVAPLGATERGWWTERNTSDTPFLWTYRNAVSPRYIAVYSLLITHERHP